MNAPKGNMEREPSIFLESTVLMSALFALLAREREEELVFHDAIILS